MTASRKGDVALKYESRNFRTYTFEKKGEAIVDH